MNMSQRLKAKLIGTKAMVRVKYLVVVDLFVNVIRLKFSPSRIGRIFFEQNLFNPSVPGHIREGRFPPFSLIMKMFDIQNLKL